jgi:hypothetical protein
MIVKSEKYMNNSKLKYESLNSEQIFMELVKRFPRMRKREGSSIGEVFDDGWEKLNETAKEIAEIKFRKKINAHEIHGIRYDDNNDGLYYLARYSAEIIKRFPLLSQGSEVCLRELFGEEWFLFGKKSREVAEERFINAIRDLDIKGITFVMNKTNFELFKNENNEILYTRTTDDTYC